MSMQRKSDEPFAFKDFLDWARSNDVEIPEREGWPAWDRLGELLVTFIDHPGPGKTGVVFEDGQTWAIFDMQEYLQAQPTEMVLDQSVEPPTLQGHGNVSMGGISVPFKTDLLDETSVLNVSGDEFAGLSLEYATDQLVPSLPQAAAEVKPSDKFPCALDEARKWSLKNLGNPSASFRIYARKEPYVEASIGLNQTVDDELTVVIMHGLTVRYPKDQEAAQECFEIKYEIWHKYSAEARYPWETNDQSVKDFPPCPPKDPDDRDPPPLSPLIRELVSRSVELYAIIRVAIAWYGMKRVKQVSYEIEMINLMVDAGATESMTFPEAVAETYKGFNVNGFTPPAATLAEAIQGSKLAIADAVVFIAAFSVVAMSYPMSDVAGVTYAYVTTEPQPIAKGLVAAYGLKSNQTDAEKLGEALKQGGVEQQTAPLAKLLAENLSGLPASDLAITMVHLDDTLTPVQITDLIWSLYPDNLPSAADWAQTLKQVFPDLQAQALVVALAPRFALLDTAGALFKSFASISRDDFAGLLYSAYQDTADADSLVRAFKNTEQFTACDAYTALTDNTQLSEPDIVAAIKAIYHFTQYVLRLADGCVEVPSHPAYNLSGEFSAMIDLRSSNGLAGVLLMRALDDAGLVKGFYVHADSDGGIDAYTGSAGGSNVASVSATPLLDQQRHQLLFCRQQDTATGNCKFLFYVDGQYYETQQGDDKACFDISVDAALNLGSPPDRSSSFPQGYFNGNVYAVKLWNRVVTPEQQDNDEGLIGWWNFDDGLLHDSSNTNPEDGRANPEGQVEVIFDPCGTLSREA